MSLVSLLDLSLKRYSQRPALWVKGRHYSYAELLGSARQLARQLQQNTDHQAILVLSNKTFIGYRNILASFYAQKTYIPLNPGFPNEKLKQIITKSTAGVILIDPSCANKWQALNLCLDKQLDVIQTCQQDTTASPSENVPSDLKTSTPSEYSYLMFTSGSTGTPKGVPVSEHNLVTYLSHISSIYDFDEYDRHSQFFEFTFDLSIHDMFVCWSSGGCSYAADEFAKLMPLHFAAKHQLTVWFSVPSHVSSAQSILKERFFQHPLSSIRLSLFCGEALPAPLARDWSKVAINSSIENLYGPTEATIAFTRYVFCPDQDPHYATVPIGQPFENNLFKIIDPSFNQVAEGEKGELYLQGPQVVSQYWHEPQKSEQVFKPFAAEHGYLTGDIVSLDQQGQLLFHGRSDQQIKIRGYRVELQEVENVIQRHSETHQVAIVPAKKGDNGEIQSLAAFYCAASLTEQQLKSLCEQHLPDYMVPEAVYKLESMPLNSSGKIDRKRLQEKLRAGENQ